MEKELTILYIEPGKPPVQMQIENNYSEFKRLLNDGYLEAVTIHRIHMVLWVDEDGKRKELMPNTAATLLFGEYLKPGDYIVGPCVVTGPADRDGEPTSIKMDNLWRHSNGNV